MSVIVFNKRTGKYLRKHSGSYRNKWIMLRYRDEIGKKIEEEIGPGPSWHEDRDGFNKHQSKVDELLKDSIFDTAPEDARVYATKSSAISSVGAWGKGSDHSKCHLPDHLKIHEIKESFVCIMRPDGSSNCDDKKAK